MLQASGFQGTVITVNTALLACTKVTRLKGLELLMRRNGHFVYVYIYVFHQLSLSRPRPIDLETTQKEAESDS